MPARRGLRHTGGGEVTRAVTARRSLIIRVLLAVLVTMATAWGMLAIFYSVRGMAALRTGLAAGFCLVVLVSFCLLSARRALVAFGLCFALLLAWYARITPSNVRVWDPDVAILADATVRGETVEITHIRNFAYRSETEFTPRYYDAAYDLDALRSVDLVVSHWSGDAIAHVFLTFGFTNGRYLAVSIETRRERGQAYSTLGGFFRHYELIYVVGDERDVIGLRTDIRHERVYLYRIQLSADARRRLFLSYIRQIAALHGQPQFYNTLTDNCTTGILRNANVGSHRIDYDWKILASGYADAYAYDIGRLDRSAPFPELKRHSLINRDPMDRPGADFSGRIRTSLAGPPPVR